LLFSSANGSTNTYNILAGSWQETSVYNVSRTTEILIGENREDVVISVDPYFFNFNLTAGIVNIYNLSIGYGGTGYYIFYCVSPGNSSVLLFENCIIFETAACFFFFILIFSNYVQLVHLSI
jgi:hypothetical protein